MNLPDSDVGAVPPHDNPPADSPHLLPPPPTVGSMIVDDSALSEDAQPVGPPRKVGPGRLAALAVQYKRRVLIGLAALVVAAVGTIVLAKYLNDPARSDAYQELDRERRTTQKELAEKRAELAALQAEEEDASMLATEVIDARRQRDDLEASIDAAEESAATDQQLIEALQAELDRLSRGEFGG